MSRVRCTSFERISGQWSFLVLVALGVFLLPVSAYDREIFLFLNGMHSRWTDPVWLGLTTAGDGFLLGIVLGAFVAVNPRVTVLGLSLLICSSAVVHLIKALADTARPAAVLEGIHVMGPLLRGGSFPSGHSASAMSAALAIAHFCPSVSGKAFAMVIGVLIAISRVFVGAHFPSDVLAGMGIAAGLGSVALYLDWWKDLIPDVPTGAARQKMPYGVRGWLRQWQERQARCLSHPARCLSRPETERELAPTRCSPAFRAAVALELFACVIGLSVYSIFFAESGLVSAGISLGCLVFLLAGLGNTNELSKR